MIQYACNCNQALKARILAGKWPLLNTFQWCQQHCWPELYAAYRKSEPWQVRRRMALAAASQRCHLCPCCRNLDVHHRTYDRVGDERLDDLKVLCRACHKKHHAAHLATTLPDYMPVDWSVERLLLHLLLRQPDLMSVATEYDITESDFIAYDHAMVWQALLSTTGKPAWIPDGLRALASLIRNLKQPMEWPFSDDPKRQVDSVAFQVRINGLSRLRHLVGTTDSRAWALVETLQESMYDYHEQHERFGAS